MLLSDLTPSKIQRFSDSSQTDAIPPALNFRRSDVCIQAISERYCPILFLLKYDGPVVVRWPMHFVSLSIAVGPTFAKKQF